MSLTSRTGLVPTPTKKYYVSNKTAKGVNECLPQRFEALAMPLSLRPFGGLFNPFARGCSVLCNHPAPSGVRNIINQLKTNLASEVRSAQLAKEKLANAVKKYDTDNIPEDLLRRYADTDSRPLTPSPTVASVRTRTSCGSFLNNRRCITPELSKNDMIKRKKIILDLRRSHSQETLYWRAASDLSQSFLEGGGKTVSTLSEDTKQSIKRPKSEEERPKSSHANCALTQEADDEAVGVLKKTASRSCINEHDLDDADVRRGKKRKKIKPQPATTTFHLSEDPETQVAALGPDSLNPSTRASLIPNSISLLPNKEKRESGEPVLLKDSFLTDDAFQVLKTELDVDVIENTFGRYLNRALREAIKYLPPKPVKSNSLKEEENNAPKTETSIKKIPRKLAKSATRFDVPLNMLALERMSVLDYLARYVWVSSQRKSLYKSAFIKHLNRADDAHLIEEAQKSKEAEKCQAGATETRASPIKPDVTLELPRFQYVERKMYSNHVPLALEEVLDFYGTQDNIENVLKIIDWHENMDKELDFRTWCGICAFAERVAVEKRNDTDSADELEKADFTSLEERLENISLSANMKRLLSIIRNSHSCNLNCTVKKTKRALETNENNENKQD